MSERLERAADNVAIGPEPAGTYSILQFVFGEAGSEFRPGPHLTIEVRSMPGAFIEVITVEKVLTGLRRCLGATERALTKQSRAKVKWTLIDVRHIRTRQGEKSADAPAQEATS